jgi:hypothetical protein
MSARTDIVPRERLPALIHVIRGQKVLLDAELVALYGVQTKVLSQAVKPNVERFPEDFMVQLTEEETELVLR